MKKEDLEGQINDNEKMIKHLEDENRARRLIVKALNEKVEYDGKVSRAFNKCVAFLAAPLARAHEASTAYLSDPVSYYAQKLNTKVEKFLTKADEAKDNKHKRARKYCKKAAMFVLRLEKLLETTGPFQGKEAAQSHLADCKETVERLRPDPDPEVEKAKAEIMRDLEALEFAN